MYSVCINGKCLKRFNTLKRAYNYYCRILNKGININDYVVLLSPTGYLLRRSKYYNTNQINLQNYGKINKQNAI